MSTRVRTIDFLPEIFKTKPNEQFLTGTLDQLSQQPKYTKMQGYIGSKFGYGVSSKDHYIVEPDKTRTNYQLEPAVIFKKKDTNTAVDLITYPGVIDSLRVHGSPTNNHNNLFTNQFYSWDSFTDLDKLINYTQYYWLPLGPEPVNITTTNVYTKVEYNVISNPTNYSFTSPEIDLNYYNPIITLVRGGTYQFVTDQSTNFWIQSQPGKSGVDAIKPNISTREVFGVDNNGIKNGIITFTVPYADSQDEYDLPGNTTIDLVSTGTFSSLNGKPAASTSIDNIVDLNGKTVVFYNGSTVTEYYLITYVPDGFGGFNLSLSTADALPTNQKITINYGTNYIGRSFVKNAYGELILIPPNTARLDTLYYQDGTINGKVGKIKIIDDTDTDYINLDDVLGRPSYTSPNGVKFTNGLKVTFSGNIFPESYKIGEYYVEGVGTAIQLIPTTDLVIPETFSQTVSTPFDGEVYDSALYGETYFYPKDKDYITISRNAFNKNAWSRSNRWFHYDVLRTTIDNTITAPLCEAALGNSDAMAKRPIIEFYPTLKLFNMGTNSKGSVNYINFTVTDAFTEVAGQNEFVPDGNTSYVFDGMTVIFAGDTNADVRNKIYTARLSQTVNSVTVPVSAFMSKVGTGPYLVKFAIPYQTYAPVVGKRYQVYSSANPGYSGIFTVTASTNTTVTLSYPSNPGIFTNSGVTNLISDIEITLAESSSGNIEYNDQASILFGVEHGGTTYYFDGLNWKQAQQKQRVNQPPLFDIFDYNGISFSDSEYYPGTDFTGCTLFEYATGTGTNDPILGFPVKYTSLSSLGDIIFNVSLNTQQFNYALNGLSETKDVKDGYVYTYTNRTDYDREIGWQTAIEDSFQYQVFNLTYTGTPVEPKFVCDIAKKDKDSTAWPTVVVYVNNSRTSEYTVSTTSNTTTITLTTVPAIGTSVDIMLYSDQASSTGYYQIPSNLDHNPFNEPVGTLSLGDVRGHYKSICNNVPNLVGPAFGPNNYRDLGNLVPYGTKIIQNSASIAFGAAFLRNNDVNFFDAANFNAIEYNKYKALIVDTINQLDFSYYNSDAEVLDEVISIITSSKSESGPFFWSDMLPSKNASVTNTYTFKTSLDTSIFPLSKTYNFTSANYNSVLIYITRRVNGNLATHLLIKDVDYIISNDEPNVTITHDLIANDIIVINEYDQTFGSYVPNTPTKVGLYPAFIPAVELDNTYLTPTYFLKGHDGSYTKLYGTYENGYLSDARDRIMLEFELRIFNNLKVSSKLPMDYADVVPGQFRTLNTSYVDFKLLYDIYFLNWIGLNRIDYKSQYYDATNEFTWNYTGAKLNFNNQFVKQGNWRGIYLWLYDTANPDTKPWEMLGLPNKPIWWEQRYGAAPYTSENTFMWTEISEGYIWNNGSPYIDSNRIRPQLLDILPVDSTGKLLSPLTKLSSYNVETFNSEWSSGDMSPAEYSYRKSSTWPFDLMSMMALSKPAKFFALGLDVDTYKFNTEFNQFLVSDRFRETPANIHVYGVNDTTAKHSYLNWLVDYSNQFGVNGSETVSNIFKNIDVRLTYRLAGFSDQDLLKFFLEKGTTSTNTSSMLIPEDSYKILLYNNEPKDTIVYSSVIVQRTENGYKVYGNKQVHAYFTVFVSKSGLYDTVTVNGLSVLVPKDYYDTTVVIPYGTEFRTPNELADFLKGYGLYLSSQGMQFNDIENGLELNWDQMIAEVLYWVQSGWEVGSTVNVNPAANILTVDKENLIVQPLTIRKQNFVLNQNLIPIQVSDLSIYRQDTLFSVKALNSGDAISYFNANLSSIEHVVVFDNETIFNDLMFNLVTGLRQQRLFVKGAKTAEWNGLMNASGFILNQDNVNEWVQNAKYIKGEIVKYKNEYWAANKVVIQPSATFNYNDWDKTSYANIQKGLLPNPSTRSAESLLYYDSNRTNLSNDADLLAFSLIGYRPRKYLVDADLDDATQVNLYKTMIESKGTTDAINILNGINVNDHVLTYSTHENWAIKTSEYGGILNQNFAEFTLNETQLTGNPSIVSIVRDVPVHGSQQQIQFYDLKNYGRLPANNNILPETYYSSLQEQIPSAGYVNVNDVVDLGYTVNDLSDANIDTVYKNDYLWIANKNNNWDIYTPYSTGAQVIRATNNLNGTISITFDKVHNLVAGQSLGVVNFDTRIDGYYSVELVVDLTTIIVSLVLDASVTSITGKGLSFLLQSQRVYNARDINGLPLLNAEYVSNKVWVDHNVYGNWTVYEKTLNYVHDSVDKIIATTEFGTQVAYIPLLGYIITDPAEGKLYQYSKTSNGYFLKNTIEYTGTSFGTAIAYSDELLIVTAPDDVLTQIYVYRIPNETNIGIPVLEQTISIAFRVGESLTISQDNNYLWLGLPAYNGVLELQLDSELSYTSTGLTLSADTSLYTNYITCSGNHVAAIQTGQRINFVTAYTLVDQLYVDIDYYPNALPEAVTQNYFICQGDVTSEFASGDKITFSNTGASGDSSQILTVYLTSYDIDNDQTYFYTVETISFNVPAGNNIYKVTFNEEGTYTVVTGIYNSTTNTTTFFTTVDIRHTAPSGAKIYFANTNFSYIGALSAQDVSLAGDNFGFSLATNYDSTKLFVGAPNNNFISGATNISDTGAAYVFDRLVQNIEVQYDQTPYSPLAILLTWIPNRYSKIFVNGVQLERNKYVIILNYIIIGIINLRAGDIIKVSSTEMVLSEQLANYDDVSDLRQGEKFGYSISCNRMGNEVIVGAPYDVVNDIEEGAVYRFTNASKRYGVMQGVIPANLYDSTYILLNGYRVQLDPTIIPITNMKYGYSGYTITDLGTTDWLSLGAEPQSVGYGSTSGTTLTVTNVTVGKMYIDSQLSSDDYLYIDNAYRLTTTSDITAGTKIVRQLTSTVPYYKTVSATAVAGTYSIHVSDITDINVGTLVYQASGSNISPNTYVYVISENISGGYDIIVTQQILGSFTGTTTYFIDPNYAFKTAFNGTGTSGDNTLYLTSYTSIVAGYMVTGTGVPDNTYVSAVRNIRARVTATTASDNTITCDYSGRLEVNEPVKFTVAIGGLSTSTQYYIKTITSNTKFTVSTSKGGSIVALSDATGVSYVEQKNVMLSRNLTSDASGNYTFRMAGKAGTYEIDTSQTVSTTVISTMNVGAVFDSTSNQNIVPSGTGYARESARAQQLAQMIRTANITNIFAYATEDDRLVIRLRDYDLGANNNKLNVSVFNGNYMTQLGFYEYPKSQTITNPHPQQRSSFGYSVKFNENNSFVVGAPATTRYAHTTFDYKDDSDNHNDTVFDNYLTDWEDYFANAGAVYMYDYIQSYEESLSNIGKYSYAQPCNDTVSDMTTNPMYGASLDFNDNVVMVGAPLFKPATDGGRAVVFANESGITDWHVYREPDPIANIDKIQKAQLYDNTTDVNLISLDYIDPMQGKLLGIVRDNLDYIGTGDPAGYNSTGNSKGNLVWNRTQVGKLWFNTSEVRFFDYHQNDVVYNAKYWGQVFPGSNVAVYSWIESSVPPSLYTGTGTPYDLAKYAVMFDIDANNNLLPKYFYWVRDTNTVFTQNGKTLSDTVLARYISNPKDSGVAFMAPLRPNTYALYNSQEYINSTTTNMHLGFSSSANDSTGHVEYKLIRANYPDDFLPGFTKPELGYNSPIGLYEKYIDSFAGTDTTGAVVPDLNLPKLMKTGVGFRPRQSLFVNRYTALKNYLEYANSIIKQYPINENGNVTFLSVVGGVNPSTVNNPEWSGGEQLFFDTTSYWTNIYWWAEGYTDKTKASTEVPLYSDLLRLAPKEGFIAGVSKNSAGKREVYIYKNSQWQRIGVQDGTVQFSTSLWDYSINKIGFGNDFFDTKTFDDYPSEETRYIIRAINEQVFTGSLFEFKNKSLTLMFEYIQSENIESQNYLPWLNRTSLVDVDYTVRELTTEARYTQDNKALLEGFINEVKPYHVVLKEFYLKYNRTEVVQGTVTDFDLPPVYNPVTDKFESPQLVYSGPISEGKYYPTDPIWESSEVNKTWFDNFGLTFTHTPNTIIASVAQYINETDSTIVVDNAYGMPYNGIITIESEVISYTDIDRITGTLSGITRGIDGTTLAPHFAGTPILIDLPSIVVLNPGRNYALTPKVTAYIDTSIYPAPTVEATFVPTMANGKVVGIEVVNPGDGYAIAPDIIVEPSITITTAKANINFTSSILVVDSTEFVTGDVVKSEGVSSNGMSIIEDGFYYIRVVVSGTTSFITFYPTVHDYEKQTNQINFISSNKLPADYQHTISITPHVIVNVNNESVRGITTSLRFDRTSYRPRISAWLPNQYWAGAHISFGNDASSPVKIYDTGAPVASSTGAGLLITDSTAGDNGVVVLTVAYGSSGLSAGHVDGSYMYFYREFDAITPAIFDGTGGKAEIKISRPNFRLDAISNQYSINIISAGSIYTDGQVIRILGTELGGQTPQNDAYVTIKYANIDGSIFSASVRGIADGNYGVYYVKVLSAGETSMDISAYADPRFEIPIPYSTFYWKGNTSNPDYGYLPEPLTANFNYAYDTTSIVYYSNAIWICLESNNDATFDPAKWQLLSNSDSILNALDRIEAFYWPTINMPAREMQQLVSGITYPNPVYYGNKFAPEDELPLDIVVQAAPFYPVNPDIVAITFDGTRYVAVGNTVDSTFILVRNQNLTWRSIVISDINLNATGIAYNDDTYVISTLTIDACLMMSFDLENWVSLGTLTGYDETVFSQYSFDITAVKSPNVPLYSVNYNNDAFYATSTGSTILRSENGITWTSVYNSGSRLSSTVMNAKYFESTYFIGYIGTGTTQIITSGQGTPAPIIEDNSLIVLSTDGINWTKLSPNLSLYQLNDSAASDDNVVLVGNNASVWYSSNAHNWVQGSISGSAITANINGVAYGNGIFVAVGNKVGTSATSPGLIMTSSDGAIWTQHSSQYITTNNLHRIIFSDGNFCAIGENDTIIESSNGINWTDLSSIEVDDPYYIVKGNDFLYGYGPEELVAGVVSDTLLLSVRSTPGATWNLYNQEDRWYDNTGFNMRSRIATPNVDLQVSFEKLALAPAQLAVFIINDTTHQSTRIYETISYTVDWINQVVTLNDPVPSGSSVMIEVYEFGNARELVRSTTELMPLQTYPSTGHSMIDLGIKYSTPIVAEPAVAYAYTPSTGMKKLVYGTDFSVVPFNANNVLLFNQTYNATTDYIAFSLFGDSATPQSPLTEYSYSLPETEVFTYDGSTSTWELSNYSGDDNETNAIVEVNGIRLNIGDWSISAGNLTVTASLTNGDIVACTTFNDTRREFLTTASKSTLKVTSITDIDVTATPYVMTTSSDIFVSGDEIVIDGAKGSIQLNGNTYYVNRTGSGIYQLYIDSGLSLPVLDVAPYLGGAYTWLDSETFTAPNPTVPSPMPAMYYIDANKTWVTINGYRVDPSILKFRDDNRLSIMTDISAGDVVLVTSMVSGASPNSSGFEIYINKNGEPSVYRSNPEDSTWLTQDVDILDTVMHFYDVRHLAEKYVTTTTVDSDLIAYINTNIDDLTNISVYNNTTEITLASEDFEIVKESGKNAIHILSGAVNGDSLTMTLYLGNVVEISGERIKFDSMDLETDTITGLTRGIDGTAIIPNHYKYEVGYGVNVHRKLPNNLYYEVWNSTIYSDKGDPLQLSNTTAAKLLEVGNY